MGATEAVGDPAADYEPSHDQYVYSHLKELDGTARYHGAQIKDLIDNVRRVRRNQKAAFWTLILGLLVAIIAATIMYVGGKSEKSV